MIEILLYLNLDKKCSIILCCLSFDYFLPMLSRYFQKCEILYNTDIKK